MRAIVCDALGDPTTPLGKGVLRYDPAYPDPQPEKGHILIKVLAASINFPDALQIKVRSRRDLTDALHVMCCCGWRGSQLLGIAMKFLGVLACALLNDL